MVVDNNWILLLFCVVDLSSVTFSWICQCSTILWEFIDRSVSVIMNWSKRPFVFLINFLEHMLSASMSQLFPWLLSVLVYVYALLVSFGFFWFLSLRSSLLLTRVRKRSSCDLRFKELDQGHSRNLKKLGPPPLSLPLSPIPFFSSFFFTRFKQTYSQGRPLGRRNPFDFFAAALFAARRFPQMPCRQVLSLGPTVDDCCRNRRLWFYCEL